MKSILTAFLLITAITVGAQSHILVDANYIHAKGVEGNLCILIAQKENSAIGFNAGFIKQPGFDMTPALSLRGIMQRNHFMINIQSGFMVVDSAAIKGDKGLKGYAKMGCGLIWGNFFVMVNAEYIATRLVVSPGIGLKL